MVPLPKYFRFVVASAVLGVVAASAAPSAEAGLRDTLKNARDTVKCASKAVLQPLKIVAHGIKNFDDLNAKEYEREADKSMKDVMKECVKASEKIMARSFGVEKVAAKARKLAASAKKAADQVSKWFDGKKSQKDGRMALAVDDKEREFYEKETGVLDERPLPAAGPSPLDEDIKRLFEEKRQLDARVAEWEAGTTFEYGERTSELVPVKGAGETAWGRDTVDDPWKERADAQRGGGTTGTSSVWDAEGESAGTGRTGLDRSGAFARDEDREDDAGYRAAIEALGKREGVAGSALPGDDYAATLAALERMEAEHRSEVVQAELHKRADAKKAEAPGRRNEGPVGQRTEAPGTKSPSATPTVELPSPDECVKFETRTEELLPGSYPPGFMTELYVTNKCPEIIAWYMTRVNFNTLVRNSNKFPRKPARMLSKKSISHYLERSSVRDIKLLLKPGVRNPYIWKWHSVNKTKWWACADYWPLSLHRKAGFLSCEESNRPKYYWTCPHEYNEAPRRSPDGTWC